LDEIVADRSGMKARPRAGYELPLLLIGAFRALIDALHRELAGLGHPEARPVHGFALQAIGPERITVATLGRRLGVSKQSAAKTATKLEELGYITRERHPTDARASQLRRTARGEELLSLSAEIFHRMLSDWSAELGDERIQMLEDDLERIVTTGSGALSDFPGWLR
jgi:DNA-binding MarR family transcriptional regulator